MKKETPNLLRIPATISKIETMSDRSLKLRVDTQELVPEDSARVFSLHDKVGVFVFSETSIKQEDLLNLPEVKTDNPKKTYSQRLRNVLFVYFVQKGGKKEDFEPYYSRMMEKIIESYKSKLDQDEDQES